MSYIVGPNIINYACTCGLFKPITQLYFCRYCWELRCSFCVCHEVDSQFCGKCCENLPSSEARLKRNRCGNCYICPCCHQELATRIGSKSRTNPDDPKSTPKKMYYLSCHFCRWSSRDVGIPDQSSATGGWPERENVHSNRLQDLIEAYKSLVVADKQKKEKERKKQRGKFVSYTDRTGVTAAALRKRLGLTADPPHPFLRKAKEPEQSVAKSEVDDLPEEIFTKPVNLMKITTLEQRFLQPELQPASVDNLFPVHKQLSIKRSLRCRTCEHNVSKSEYNPNSVKFKIQLFAYYHIPEIRLVTVEPLRAGKQVELILKLTNPTQHQTTVTFLPLNFNIRPEEEEEEVEEKSPPKSLSESQPTSLLSLSARHLSITIKPRKNIENCNTEVVLSESSVILPPRDDAAEYDDSGDTHNIQDDHTFVLRRKSNKAFVKLMVTPGADLEIGTPLLIGFTMKHIYTNTIATTIENKEPDMREHFVKLLLKIGNLVGSE